MLPLSAITRDDDLQPRAKGLNKTTVADYAERIRVAKRSPGAKGKKCPAIVVYDDGEKKWLSEGFHRYASHELAGEKTILCEVRTGTRDDAKLNALASNQEHGLMRSRADIRRAVKQMLELRPEWTDHRIAEHVGASQPTVSKYRQLINFINCGDEKREGKDGKTYTVKPKRSKKAAATPDVVDSPDPAKLPEPSVTEPAPEPEPEPEPEPAPVPPPAPTWRDLPVGNPHESNTEAHKRAEKAFAWAKITTMGQLADFLDTDHGGFALKPWEERDIANHLAKHRVAVEPPDAPWRSTPLDMLAVSNPFVYQRLASLDITTLGHLSDRLDAGGNFGFPPEILDKFRGHIRDARDGRPSEPTPAPVNAGTPNPSTNADTPHIRSSTGDTASTQPVAEPDANPGQRKVADRAEWERGLKLFRQGVRVLSDLANRPSGVFLRNWRYPDGSTAVDPIKVKRADGGTREEQYFPDAIGIERVVAAMMPARIPCAGCGGTGSTKGVECIACSGHGAVPHNPAFWPDQGRSDGLFDEAELW